MRAFRDLAAPSPLPYGLAMLDTMASVQRRPGQPKVSNSPEAGWEARLPDFSGSPDHAHNYAVYKRFGATIVYNPPFSGDKNAVIRSVIVH